jgi:hypothetical protein
MRPALAILLLALAACGGHKLIPEAEIVQGVAVYRGTNAVINVQGGSDTESSITFIGDPNPRVQVSCMGASGVDPAQSADKGRWSCTGAHAIRLEGQPDKAPTKLEGFACIGPCNPINTDRYLRLRFEIPAAQ